MFYLGYVSCTLACSIIVYSAGETLDSCLTKQSNLNEQAFGRQIALKFDYYEGQGMHLDFGCFKYNPTDYDLAQKLDRSVIETMAWNKFGPKVRDSNVKRILKRRKYDMPPPVNAMPNPTK